MNERRKHNRFRILWFPLETLIDRISGWVAWRL